MKRRNFLKSLAGLPALALFPWSGRQSRWSEHGHLILKPFYLTGTYSWYGGEWVEEISEEWFDNASKEDIAQASVDLIRWRGLV